MTSSRATHLVVAVAAFLAGRLSALGVGITEPLADVAADVLPHLVAAPAGHGDVEVTTTTASVQTDARGEIHNFKLGGARFNVLVTRAGVLRSGDVHRHVQYDAIFSGRVAVTSREGGRDVRREYGAGDFIALPAHTPHLFEFLNHTVMAEWWEHVSDRGEPFEARYYTPYRQRISAAMLRGGRRRGPPR